MGNTPDGASSTPTVALLWAGTYFALGLATLVYVMHTLLVEDVPQALTDTAFILKVCASLIGMAACRAMGLRAIRRAESKPQ